MDIYVVKEGDTVNAIAAAYQIAPSDIIYVNQLVSPYPLAIGQALLIPTESDVINKKSIVTNGYAYPHIDRGVLESTLPYLSELSVFSYGFTKEGVLVFPAVDDSFMIELSNQYGTRPILTLAPLDENAQFNNNLVTALVSNADAQDNLINQLFLVLEQKGYKGINIDFEYVLASDADGYVAFVQSLTLKMNENGYTVSIALPPKTSREQPGVLYEGADYRRLGEAANSVLLMTYEWGYTYSEPMAVAPINKVRDVVDFAVTEIPNTKINLGIPNYGYDWILPYQKGVTRATAISNITAVRIAVSNNAEIQFDETAQSPYFHYWANGIEHEVWFEDVRSMRAKFGLVSEYDLMGVGYWQIMRLFLANWILLEDTFDIIKV